MAQAIPIVTHADPTPARTALTEGYLSQPLAMGHAMWEHVTLTGTLNLEGLTLKRGELSTGGYGEGYVDRRHPHSYLHELLAGVNGSAAGFHASLFAGRGFVPFGTDDPMVRPFEKYPINHHLAQILERTVTVAAVRRGPAIGEFSVFNGDEPTGPGAPPAFHRFADSWSSRLTLLPVSNVELSGSVARVKSPEVAAGGGADQHKASLAARYQVDGERTSRYLLAEWAHTNEVEQGSTAHSLTSLLAEGSYCRAGVIGALRLERTDRAEEDRLANPFRTPRPPLDVPELGVSRWTTVTAALSAPAARWRALSGRPFVEVSHLAAAAQSPPFDVRALYGKSSMWMLTTGIRLRAGSMHDRMGRYGVAVPDMSMASSASSTASMEMPDMPDMSEMPHAMPMGSSTMVRHAAAGMCTL